jgi:hypothetical protein
LELPHLIKVTARPFKPSCSDCVVRNHMNEPEETGDVHDK